MGKVALVFPGQGAQYVGMGRDFYEQIAVCKKIYDMASEVTGLDIPKICLQRMNRFILQNIRRLQC